MNKDKPHMQTNWKMAIGTSHTQTRTWQHVYTYP